MALDLRRPVVAVFGPNNPSPAELRTARMLGAAVGRRRSLLLTGGDRVDADTVKDGAIVAMVGAETPEDPASWIGVANRRHAEAPQGRGPASVVVTPGWGHRRNFVEAVMCDAAFAVGGHSEGTACEALFCLSLGRPVVVVGPASPAQAEARALREQALRRIAWPQDARLAVDRGIARAYEWADQPDRAAQLRPLPADETAADALVTELLGRIERPSPRPDLDVLVDEGGWDAYLASALRDA